MKRSFPGSLKSANASFGYQTIQKGEKPKCLGPNVKVPIFHHIINGFVTRYPLEKSSLTTLQAVERIGMTVMKLA